MAFPQTLRKKTLWQEWLLQQGVPEPPMRIGVMGGANKPPCPQTLKLTMKQRQEKLFEELDLSGLESWPPELVDSA